MVIQKDTRQSMSLLLKGICLASLYYQLNPKHVPCTSNVCTYAKHIWPPQWPWLSKAVGVGVAGEAEASPLFNSLQVVGTHLPTSIN